MMGWGYGSGFHGAWGIAGIVLMVLFWAAVILVLIAVVRWRAGGRRDQDDRNRAARADKTPTEILDERFARGEIEAEEYQARKRLLEPHDARPD